MVQAHTSQRFEIRNRLGAGGMGVVYAAYDHRRGHEVALKKLRGIDPTRFYLFKSEFRAVAGVSHPNLVQLYELIAGDDGWFFTMELIDGVTFLEYVRPGPDDLDGFGPLASQTASGLRYRQKTEVTETSHTQGLVEAVSTSPVRPGARPRLPRPRVPKFPRSPDVNRLRDALEQVTLGVMALHREGTLHRDLKPSNVLVTRDGRLAICDFSIALDVRRARPDGELDETMMGTLSYCAPEQLRGTIPSPASDWYSVGVMLYQALVGDVPVRCRRVEEALRFKDDFDPVPPSELNPDLPEDLEELTLGLLAADPERRLDGQDILRRLRHASRPREAVSLEPERGFIARRKELDALTEAYRSATRGQAVEVRVHGQPGMGKSRLVRAFLDAIGRQDGSAMLMLEARAYERESVPFKALDSALDSLARQLLNMLVRDVQNLLPPDMDALAAMFPVLRRVPAVEGLGKAGGEDLQILRRRAAAALRELLFRLAERRTVVLYLEDLQWGDADSATLLTEVLKPPCEARILVIISYRTEGAALSPFLKTLDDATEATGPSRADVENVVVEVGPLEREAARTMASSLLGADHRQWAEQIAVESGGNPLFVEALSRHVESGADLGPAGQPSSLTLTEVLLRRFDGLDDEARSLLDAICLTTRPTADSILRDAVPLGPRWDRAWSTLNAERLVRTRTFDEVAEIEPFHDRIREVLVANLPEGRTRAAHFRLAESVERAGGGGSIDAAQHFALAGEWARAMPHALAAAKASLDQYAFDSAETLLGIAARAAREGLGDASARRQVWEMNGDIEGYRGHFDAAQELYNRARSEGTSTLERAELDFKASHLTLHRGLASEAARGFEATLAMLGRAVPSARLRVLGATLVQTLIQVVHSLFRSHYIATRDDDPARKVFLGVMLYNRLSLAYFISGDPRGFWAHMSGLNLIERYRPTTMLARMWSEHSMAMLLVHKPERARHYAEQGVEIAERLGDPSELGQSLVRHGQLLYCLSEWDASRAHLRRAIHLLARAGNTRETLIVANHLALSYYRSGNLEAAAAQARNARDAAEAAGDDHALASALTALALSSGGDVPEEVLRRQIDLTRDDLLSFCLLARGTSLAYLRTGRTRDAIDLLEEAFGRIRAQRMNNPYTTAAVPAALASAWRTLAEETEDPRARSKAIARGRKLARIAARHAVRFTNDLPHALREAGNLAALAGDHRKASTRFAESVRVAEAQGALLERGLTLRARAKVAVTVGARNTTEDLEAAEENLRELGAGFLLTGSRPPRPR